MEFVLVPLVGSCAKKLQDVITEEAILILGVQEDLTQLQRTLRHIQCFLIDAEQRRTKELAVNNWLSELRDAMYNADDIIDLVRSEGGKLLAEQPSSSRKSNTCAGISLFGCIPNVLKRHKIAVQIRDFNAELEKISKLGGFLNLQNVQPTDEVSTMKQNVKRSSLVEPNLVGKETLYACRKLVKKVLEQKEKNAYKLGIVGTGGVGKTTLAQKIYNDENIKGKFSYQSWICISQKYSEVSILQEVLRNFGVHHEQSETIAELSNKLATAIQNKSFFLVLDDVWQPEVWTDLLRTPLHAAATGVILVTTRQDTTARAIGIEQEEMHPVELMSTEVGWELLWKSMGITKEEDVENLRSIGFEIVRKCGGLPLAIKVIASILATKEKTKNAWTRFTNRSAWTSMGDLPNGLSGALYLSYDDLPRHLKQCFLYCALFPEDYTMLRDDLIRLWVAEGFVVEQEGQLLEDTAEEYYYELIYRNLLQPERWTFDSSKCKMHDLLLVLARHVSREQIFCGDPQEMEGTTLSKLHRVSVDTKQDSIIFPGLDKQTMRARTLFIIYGKRRVENTIFGRLPCIRVLTLNNKCIQSIPDSVGNLIHLRLLDLDGTDISCLPESIGSLMNLQILNLQRCESLHALPLAITQLINLRRLGLDETPINQVPKGIGRLELLNDLEGFPIGGGGANAKTHDGWVLEELGQLSKLRQIHMINLERAVPCKTDSLLDEKKYLKVMSLYCSECTNGSYAEEDVCNIEKIFEQLMPPQNLEELIISRFFGRRYPMWLGTIHLSSLKFLLLQDCNSCVQLPPVGQLPNLKYLRIDEAAAVTKIGPEFLGYREANPRSREAAAFPKLEWLILRDMPNWEEWSFVEEDAASTEGGEDGVTEIQKGKTMSPRLHLLPQLKTLKLQDCPKLRVLPRQLGQRATNLKMLFITRASCLKVVEDLPFLSEMLSIQTCAVLERVSNIPQVRTLRVHTCPNLKRVEGFGCLQQLYLDESTQESSAVPRFKKKESSAVWVTGLQQKHRELHGEDVDVYPWRSGITTPQTDNPDG